KKLSIDRTKLTLKKGASYTLNVTKTPITTLQKITFTSSKSKVAKVDKKGKITAKKKGTATITVKCGSKKKKVKVTVK
ncbi:MAG: Ig-like domain-containing protein, partial [Lachnospiraceae bacterium]|nr:Ig-like domain-containing protein [Lachnospiraceae bacterium]